MLIPANRVESTLAVAFTQGTSTEIALASVANCLAKSVVYIDDDVEWCLVKYGLLDVPNKKLKTLTNPLAVYQSSGANGHEFPIGTTVCVAAAADLVEQLFLKSATDKTISGGVISVDPTRRVAAYLVDTEGGGASDNLDTISGGAEGMLILLRAKDAAHTVVVKHNTGNVLTAGADISLTDTDLYILLAWDTALTKWVVVGGGGGGGLQNVVEDTTPQLGGDLDRNGHHIPFPATANPSADPNTLDDYEEGTWTPDLQFGGAKVDITYSMQTGDYRKIGSTVFLRGSITLTSKGSSNGNASIEGFPFTPAVGDKGGSVGYMINITFAEYLLFLIQTSPKLQFYETTEAGATSAITDGNFANNSRIAFSCFYTI